MDRECGITLMGTEFFLWEMEQKNVLKLDSQHCEYTKNH